MCTAMFRLWAVVFVVFAGVIHCGKVSVGETILVDEFDDSNLNGWYQWFGHASAVDGSMNITVDGHGRGVMRSLGLNLEDTSIRVQGRLLDDSSSLALVARHRPGNPVNRIGSYFGSIYPDGSVHIEGGGGGGAAIQTHGETDLSPMEEDVLLQLDVTDNTIKLWAWRVDEPMPVEPLISTTDPRNSQPFGDIAVASFSFSTNRPKSALFRYVKVADQHLTLVPGDYNDDGTVEQGDLDLVLLNWGDEVTSGVANWINNPPTDGVIDQNDLDRVLLNWGGTAAVAASVVPEPASACLVIMTLVAVSLGRRSIAALGTRRSLDS